MQVELGRTDLKNLLISREGEFVVSMNDEHLITVLEDLQKNELGELTVSNRVDSYFITWYWFEDSAVWTMSEQEMWKIYIRLKLL